MSKSRGKNQRGTFSGKNEARREQLAQALGLWARETMHLKESLVPTNEELKQLMRDTNSMRVWDHVVACIHSSGSADVVKKNLQLHSGGLSKKEEVNVRQLELEAELNSLKVAVLQMTKDISRLQADIKALACENGRLQGEVNKGLWRKTLLSAELIKSREEVGFLQEYSRRISQRKNYFCTSNREMSYFTLPGGVASVGTGEVSDGSKSLVLESACKRDVGVACKGMKELLTLLSEGDGQENREEMDKARAQVWSKVESLLCTYPPNAIVQCLCELATEEAAALHQDTSSLNLATDAAQLKCQFNQSFGETASESSFLQSVEDHLMEEQLAHLRRCVECEKSRDAAKHAQERLEAVKGQAEELLWKQLPSDADQVKRDLMRAVFFQQLEESGYEAMLETLISLCAGLESSRAQRRDTLAALQAKKDQIDQFAKSVESKELEIRRLVKMNSAGRERLQRQRSELELYMKKNVCAHKVPLLALKAGLIGLGAVELELFSLLDLERAFRTPRISTPTCELSIHRLQPSQPSGFPGWEKLLAVLELPPHVSPLAFLNHVISLVERVESLTKELSVQRQLLHVIKHFTVNSKHSQGVLQASREYDNQLCSKGINTVSDCLSLASRGLAQCSSVQQLLQEWWDEPAQLCVPWVTHEDMCLSKWLEQWRVLTAKLKQLSQST